MVSSGRNHEAMHIYTGRCPRCRLYLYYAVKSRQAESLRWTRCSGERGCGAITRLTRWKTKAPGQKVTYKEWEQVFDGPE